jgi:catechol 2,3-dioxygenase-like lactoylglutathione lyase family enzyme
VRVGALHHAGLVVADLERSLRFYHDLLRIPVRERVEDVTPDVVAVGGWQGQRARIADLDLGDGRVLELIEDRDHPPPADHAGSHIAFQVDDIVATYRRLRRAGVPARSKPQPLGPEAGRHWAGCIVVYMTDPDGATVELVQVPET